MPNLEIKEIYGNDALPYISFSCPAFHKNYPWLGDEKKGAEVWRRQDEEKRSLEAGGVSYRRIGAFAGDRLAANVEIHPFTVLFDSHTVPMGCIGEVCCDVEFRRNGAVRSLMSRALELMYENGQSISYLNPFTANYYRRFGYEATCEQTEWTIPIEYLPEYSGDGIIHYTGNDEQKADVRRIWESWNEENNLSEIRGERSWNEWFCAHTPGSTQNFGYLHYTDGIADGFVNYTDRPNDSQPMLLDARNGAFWYTCISGLRSLLSFMSGFRDYASALKILLPVTAEIEPMIEITGGWGKKHTERRIIFNGMSRIVDVEKSLNLCEFKGSGKVCVGINDPMCSWNNGMFTVDFSSNERQVSRGGEADIELSIGAFSSLLLGHGGLTAARYYGGTKINGNTENLEKLFYSKTVFSQTIY